MSFFSQEKDVEKLLSEVDLKQIVCNSIKNLNSGMGMLVDETTPIGLLKLRLCLDDESVMAQIQIKVTIQQEEFVAFAEE